MRKRFSNIIITTMLSASSVLMSVQAQPPVINRYPIQLNTITSEDIVYSRNETAALIRDGDYAGYMQINFVQKLGIYDWYNNKSMINDVKHSYAINVSVDLTKLLKTDSSVIMKPTIEFENSDGVVIGKSTKIGWSGYPEGIELYNSNGMATFEIVVQQTEHLSDETFAVFYFEEDGHTLEPVKYSLKGLEQQKPVISLKSAKEPTQIVSINGGKYTFSVDSVVISSNKFTPPTEYSSRKQQTVCDVKMRIRYEQAPKNKELHTRYDLDGQMNTMLVFGLQTDLSNKLLYKSNNALLEKQTIFKEDNEGEVYFSKYVYERYANLIEQMAVGDTITITFNRTLEDATPPLEKVRILFEFPEERKSQKDFTNFKGRYVVYELPVEWEGELYVED